MVVWSVSWVEAFCEQTYITAFDGASEYVKFKGLLV